MANQATARARLWALAALLAAGAAACGKGSPGARADAGASGTGRAGGAVQDAAAPEHAPRDTGGPCPAAPPFDDTDPDIVQRCTQPVFVAVGNWYRQAISYDGTTWFGDVWSPGADVTQGNENSHRNAAIARGVIVIVGDGGILVSNDGGVSFQIVNNGRHHDASIAFFQGAFWVVSNVGTLSSPDGVSWTTWLGQAQVPGGLSGSYNAASSAVGGSKLIALNGRTTSYRTFDGANWTETAFGADYGDLAKIAFGGGRFVILSQRCCDETMFAGLRAASTDGVAWMLVTNATPGAPNYLFDDLVWDGARFFATASQYDPRGYSSIDGLQWEQWTNKSPQNDNVALDWPTFLEGTYVASGGIKLYRSTDARTWTLTHTAVGDAGAGFTHVASGRVLLGP